jgi:ABC-2 type transport system permease protein
MVNQSFHNKKDLLVELVRTSFKLRYNNSVLGFLWVLLKPLMMFLILYAVFSRFSEEGVENYSIYLLTGVIIYTLFSEGMLLGMNSLLDKGHIILKVNFPRQVAVFSALIMAAINFVINLLILLIFILFNPINTNIVAVGYFFFISITVFLITTALSFFSSIIAVKLRDLQNIFEVLLQIGFYATPVIFPISFIPRTLFGFESINPQQLIALNPLTTLLQAARSALITGEIIDLDKVLLIFAGTLLILFFGNLYFKATVKRVAEYF